MIELHNIPLYQNPYQAAYHAAEHIRSLDTASDIEIAEVAHEYALGCKTEDQLTIYFKSLFNRLKATRLRVFHAPSI